MFFLHMCVCIDSRTWKMEISNATRRITLAVTELQYDVIRNLFNHYEWDFEGSLREDVPLNDGANIIQAPVSVTSNENGSSSGSEDQDNEGGQHRPENECPHCYCSPCVTATLQTWLGNGSPAHNRNAGLRRVRYRKFWTMLDRRGAWNDPRYIRKKRHFLRRNRDDSVAFFYAT